MIALFCTVYGMQNISAQTLVKLRINHKLGTENYAKNTTKSNNLGHNFNIQRLEYYLSSIVVIHDGGMMDTIKNAYFLVNPSSPSETMTLDSVTFTNIEAIQFGVGVDASRNNGNPADYLPGHPLAPKSPSMHWGWTAGYRFLAIEGKSGVNVNQTYELHGLWNRSYYIQRIPATTKNENGDVIIELNANYSNILKDIELNSGVIAHGAGTTDDKALQNMRDHVFTNTNGTSNVLSVKSNKAVSILTYPNPIQAKSTLNIKVDGYDNYIIKVTNLSGQVVFESTANATEMSFNKSGIYLIQIYSDKKKLLATHKQLVL